MILLGLSLEDLIHFLNSVYVISSQTKCIIFMLQLIKNKKSYTINRHIIPQGTTLILQVIWHRNYVSTQMNKSVYPGSPKETQTRKLLHQSPKRQEKLLIDLETYYKVSLMIDRIPFTKSVLNIYLFIDSNSNLSNMHDEKPILKKSWTKREQKAVAPVKLYPH